MMFMTYYCENCRQNMVATEEQIPLFECVSCGADVEQLRDEKRSIVRVSPVIDYTVRALCWTPYPLHPKGCPNAGKCDRCPPAAPLYGEVFDLTQPIYAVVNEFDLAGHVARMAAKNPAWSDRQLRCVLYWQNTARKQLDAKIKAALEIFPGYTAVKCPEGMGVNVTATLAQVGIVLEWPPQRIARHVALLAIPKEG